jgi:hypothetical protein
MFIDHTYLFGCMAWWVRTRVLTKIGLEKGLNRQRPYQVQPHPSHGLPRLYFVGAYVRVARVPLNSSGF